MTDPQLDLTTHLGGTLRALDALIEGELRPQIAEAVDVARRMLATSREPFGWRFIDLGSRDLPEGIRVAVFYTKLHNRLLGPYWPPTGHRPHPSFARPCT